MLKMISSQTLNFVCFLHATFSEFVNKNMCENFAFHIFRSSIIRDRQKKWQDIFFNRIKRSVVNERKMFSCLFLVNLYEIFTRNCLIFSWYFCYFYSKRNCANVVYFEYFLLEFFLNAGKMRYCCFARSTWRHGHFSQISHNFHFTAELQT